MVFPSFGVVVRAIEKVATANAYTPPQKPIRMSQPERRKPQQDDPDHRAQPLPTRIGLLDDHDPGQQRHRHEAAHADPKHDQHQRPAAAQAERAVAHTKAPSCSYAVAIVAHEEG